MSAFLYFTAQEIRGLRAVIAHAGAAGLAAALPREADRAVFNTAWDILEREQTLSPMAARLFEAFFSARSSAEVGRALTDAKVNPASYERALAKIHLRAA